MPRLLPPFSQYNKRVVPPLLVQMKRMLQPNSTMNRLLRPTSGQISMLLPLLYWTGYYHLLYKWTGCYDLFQYKWPGCYHLSVQWTCCYCLSLQWKGCCHVSSVQISRLLPPLSKSATASQYTWIGCYSLNSNGRVASTSPRYEWIGNYLPPSVHMKRLLTTLSVQIDRLLPPLSLGTMNRLLESSV